MATVEELFVAPAAEAPVEPRERVEAVAGAGLRGDRYFGDGGSFEGDVKPPAELTAIDAGAVAAAERHGVGLAPGVHRRNVVVRGLPVDDHVGDRLRIGGAIVEATRGMTPCTYLERELERAGVDDPAVPRGGVRCRIVAGGRIAVGDPVSVVVD